MKILRLSHLPVFGVLRYLILPLFTAFASQSHGQEYEWSTIAGNTGGPGVSDGPAESAHFQAPTGVAADRDGNLYVADTENHTIRRITPLGTVSTFAGSPGVAGTADGLGTAARFRQPSHVAVDLAGMVYVADQGNHTLRKILPGGQVITLAGNAGFSGFADGTGAVARFDRPASVAVGPDGMLYVADFGNHTIRKVTAAGVVTTLTGSHGQPGSTDGPADNARFKNPRGIAAALDGTLYVADEGNRTIRAIAMDGTVSTLAGQAGLPGSIDGTGNAARFQSPSGVTVDRTGILYIADSFDHTLRRITAAGEVTTLAGLSLGAGFADGTGTAARFSSPVGVAVDSGDILYVADAENDAVRKVTGAGVVTTLTGGPLLGGTVDGTGTAARFRDVFGIVEDLSGNLYVSEFSGNTIRKITRTGEVTTWAGSAGTPGSANGTGTAARFDGPAGMAIDASGNLYVADANNNIIRKVTPAGAVTTLAGSPGQSGTANGTGSAARFNGPRGVAVDASGNVYVADFLNHAVRKITSAGVVTTLAGTAGTPGTANGSGASARFNRPAGLVLYDGNLYVADNSNAAIRKVTAAGVVTTFAGTPGVTGSVDATGSAARFGGPVGIGVDGGGYFIVSDGLNHTIRKITPGGAVTTIGGSPQSALIGDGRGSAARFQQPAGVFVTPTATVYVADTGNRRIVRGIDLTEAPALDTSFTWGHTGAGLGGAGPFGDNGIETYGQTFIAPAERKLTKITVYVDDELQSGTVSNPAYLDFKVYVMAWTGSRATGPILFQSAKITTNNNSGAGGMQRFDVSTGGIDLTPGGKYVFFLSDSGLFDGNRSTGAVGFLEEKSMYDGGELVIIDNQQDTSKWTTEDWRKDFPTKDMAFKLEFAAGDISIHDGPGSAAPDINDGQIAPISFGTARVGTPVERTFPVTNTGTSPLKLTSVSVPPGYTWAGLPLLPANVDPGQSLAFRVQLIAGGTGTFAGRVVITSDDLDEASFDFAVEGRVVTPEITVFNGSAMTSPELISAQTEPVDFGTARQGTPVIRSVLIANTGTDRLLLKNFSVPTGYTLLNAPGLPAFVETGASLLLNLRLDATTTGAYAGSMIITSDDFDESFFYFPVIGTVVTPEIEVYQTEPGGPLLTDGQATPVNFGRNVQGTPGQRTFAIVNLGSAPLLISAVTLPPGYTAQNLPATPLTIGANQGLTFQLSLNTTQVGTHAGSVVINSDDLDEAAFDFPVTGEVFIPDPVSSAATTSTTLNRQTGLREQSLHITNDTTAMVPAYNLIIRGLPAGVEVNNASEIRPDGSFVVYIRSGMPPRTSQDIVIEYYSADRNAVEVNPQLSTEVVLTPPDLTAATAETGLAINTIKSLTGGVMLIEFASSPGKRYQVQYSADGLSWQNSLPQIKAASNRTQWIDRGLPRTGSAPAEAESRMYRVREVTP